MDTTASRFCTRCGGPLDGPAHVCATPRRRVPWLGVAVAMLVAVQGLQAWVVTRVRQDAEAARAGSRADLAARDRQLADLRARLDAQPDAVVARTVQQSVFTVRAGDAIGSAFVVSAKGGRSFLVTNAHVVGTARSVEVQRDELTFPGRVIEHHEERDIAVIEVGHAFQALPVAPRAAQVGDAVLAVGSPLGLGGSVTSGIVSALRPDRLQFSAPISPGNSGGPVVDARGRVVAVAVAKAVGNGAEGLSFAIPVARVCATIRPC